MINESTLYWITRLDSFHGFLTGLIFATVVLTVISFLCIIELYTEYAHCIQEQYVKQKLFNFRMSVVWFAICLLFVFTSGLIKVFLPNTKEMAFIKIVPIIAANENIEELSTDSKKIMKLMVKYIENQIQILPEQEEENVKNGRKIEQ